MDLELKIQNFGPIDEATIQVGRFTVFAGPNNTGKTFVAKMLYSMLGTINANPVLVFFEAHAGLIYRILEWNRDLGATGERVMSDILESQFYWKLKNPLESIRLDPQHDDPHTRQKT